MEQKTLTDIPLETLRDYIDWTPFFHTWRLKGLYPNILTDKVYGEEASKLFAEANELLDRIVREKSLTAQAVFGLFPANSDEDDIYLYQDEERTKKIAHLNMLRSQRKMEDSDSANLCLSDFVAPVESEVDYMGAFVVSTGKGLETLEKEFESQQDDYQKIMAQALADRLAEATAEYLHEKIRKEYWGYAKSENLEKEELIKESYQGIRPAPGYAACPDHHEKIKLFEVLKATEEIGVSLTESCAMTPGASVSGWYFSHKNAKYFNVGKINEEQVESYSERKGLSLAEVKKWLAPNLME